MTKYLRNKRDGYIYEWNDILADNPLCEEVTEEEAFPERFTPPEIKIRRSKLNITPTVIEEPPPIEFPEINADASRGLENI
jgi:hypothetical protein